MRAGFLPPHVLKFDNPYPVMIDPTKSYTTINPKRGYT